MTTQQIISIASGTDDAQVSRITSGVYPPTSAASFTDTGTTMNAIREFATPNYRIFNALMKFDTSVLPDDAVIVSALLRVVTSDKQFQDSLSLVGDYYTWTGTASDYSATPFSTAIAPVAVSTLGASGTTINFTLLAPRLNISVTGTTAIRLHLTQLAADAAPTGRNYYAIWSYDHLTLPEPKLVVDYELSTRMAPDAILSTNLVGSVSDIQDDARSPDANWLTIS